MAAPTKAKVLVGGALNVQFFRIVELGGVAIDGADEEDNCVACT